MSKNISELISDLRGGRSYQQLSEDCGGIPSYARLAAMVREGITVFPTVESIHGLAKGLEVSQAEIVDACGVSLKLWAETKQREAISLPRGAGNLTQAQKAAVVGIVREFIKANAGA